MTDSVLAKRAPLLAAVILLLELRPYFTWSFIENSFVKIVLLILLIALFSSKRRKMTRKETPCVLIFFLATFCYLFLGFICGRMNINGFLGNLVLFFLISLPLCQKRFGESVYDYFTTLFSLLVGVSLSSWILFHTLGLPQLGTLELLGQHRHYLHYPFFVIEILDFTSLDFLRFYGPFDEPGVIGTYGALILAVSKYNLKDWRLIIIFVAGLFSFSLFFYIVSITYLLFYFIAVKKNAVFSLLLLGSFFMFYIGTKDNPIFYEYIWKRTEWDASSNTIAGDDRSNDDVDAHLKKIRGTSEYYIGTSDSDWYNNVAGGSSSTYKSIICIHGVVFFILYIGFFIILGMTNKTKKAEALLYCIVVLANFYQRSSIYFPVTIFLYCAFAMDYAASAKRIGDSNNIIVNSNHN